MTTLTQISWIFLETELQYVTYLVAMFLISQYPDHQQAFHRKRLIPLIPQQHFTSRVKGMLTGATFEM